MLISTLRHAARSRVPVAQLTQVAKLSSASLVDAVDPSTSAKRSNMQFYVSHTAVMVSHIRSQESQRPDALFVDPIANKMYDPEVVNTEMGTVDSMSSFFMDGDQLLKYLTCWPIIRHRFFDDKMVEVLARAYESGKSPQVVNMAAGLDGRAFRDLPYPPGTTLYEVDRKEVLEYKARRLESHGIKPLCRRVAIPADLLMDSWEDQLVKQGFRPDHPTVWLAEGLVMYLPPEKVQELVQRMSALSSNGSFFGADCTNLAFFNFWATKGMLNKLKEEGAPLLFGTDHPERFLEEAGWDTPKVYQFGDPEAHYGRWPFPGSLPRWVPNFVPLPRIWLMTATINHK